MILSLEGKIVLVTGAASGIGRAVAGRIAEAGAEGIFLTDRDGPGCARVAATLAQDAVATAGFTADLMSADAPATIVAAAIERFGRVDALVNAAGLTTRASVEDGSAQIWDSLFAVNARAPFFLMQQAIADMRRRKAPGAIVNVLSMNAHCGAPDLAIYSATKGALQTLTKNAANAHLADRIRVNGLNLGWALTEAEDRLQSETLGKGPGWAEEAARELPLGRLLDADEAARHILFMLSDASNPMTGVVSDLEQKVTGA